MCLNISCAQVLVKFQTIRYIHRESFPFISHNRGTNFHSFYGSVNVATQHVNKSHSIVTPINIRKSAFRFLTLSLRRRVPIGGCLVRTDGAN